ncbi:MAG: hypothetical protein ACPKQO_01650 [Nitrososphaeraceae archaeon]
MVPLLMISNSVYGQYSKFDFILELDDVTNNPKITYFEARDESSKDICPFKECKIDYELEWFSKPTEEVDGSTFKINFVVMNNTIGLDNQKNNTIGLDNQKNNTIGLDNQKLEIANNQTLQKYQMSMFYCEVNGEVINDYNELYFCNEKTNILRESDLKNWYYNSSAIYDANFDTYTVVGKYIGNSTL